MRQAVGTASARPVVGNENGVGSNCLHHHCLECDLAAARSGGYPIAVLDSILPGETRVNFDSGIRILIEETADTPRLRAGKILADDAAGREINRKLRRHRIATLMPFGNDKAMFAIRMKRAAVLEEAGSSRMVERRARPKHPHVFVDLLVSDAIVVGMSAARRFPQLVVNLARRAVWKELFLAETLGDFAVDPTVASGVSGRIDGFPDVNDTAFGRTADSFLFFLETAGQHDVGIVSGFGHEKIHDA